MTSFIWCNNDQKRFSDSFSSCMYIPNNASDRETPIGNWTKNTQTQHSQRQPLCIRMCP